MDEIAKLLLAGGADVEAVGHTGLTPLLAAVHYDNAASLQVLLANNANLSVLNEMGATALHIATEGGSGAALFSSP